MPTPKEPSAEAREETNLKARGVFWGKAPSIQRNVKMCIEVNEAIDAAIATALDAKIAGNQITKVISDWLNEYGVDAKAEELDWTDLEERLTDSFAKSPLLLEIRAVASGERQVADNDTEALAWIVGRIDGAYKEAA